MDKINWKIKYCQLDVRQGDAAILIFEGFNKSNNSVVKKSILIDGGDKGNAGNVANIDEILKKEGISSLDAVVFSHLDTDHLKGIIELKDTHPNYFNNNTKYFRPGVRHISKTAEVDFAHNFGTIDGARVIVPQIGHSVWEYIDHDFYTENQASLNLSNSKIPNLTFLAVDGANIENPNQIVNGSPAHQNNMVSIASLINLNKFNLFVSGDINAQQEMDMAKYFADNGIELSARKVSHHLSHAQSDSRFYNSFQEADLPNPSQQLLDRTRTNMTAYTDPEKPYLDFLGRNLVNMASYGNKHGHPHQPAIDNSLGRNTMLYVTNPVGSRSTARLSDIGFRTTIARNRNENGNIWLKTDSNNSLQNRFFISTQQFHDNDNSLHNKVHDYYIKNIGLMEMSKRLEYLRDNGHFKFVRLKNPNITNDLKEIGRLKSQKYKYNIIVSQFSPTEPTSCILRRIPRKHPDHPVGNQKLNSKNIAIGFLDGVGLPTEKLLKENEIQRDIIVKPQRSREITLRQKQQQKMQFRRNELQRKGKRIFDKRIRGRK